MNYRVKIVVSQRDTIPTQVYKKILHLTFQGNSIFQKDPAEDKRHRAK